MKKLLFYFSLFFVPTLSYSQDTFSIVAVDSVTGEIGSAGASCLGIVLPVAPHGAQIISDVIPGVGAIHTQAQYDHDNQQNAHTHLRAGESPQQIIAWLRENDSQSDSSIRQYGVVDYHSGHPRSAGFTGSNCLDYKNHLTGVNYCIQGNILLGRQILDSIQSRFLQTNGTLAQKLMAALQGAKVVGADTRCSSHNTSSLSSFIRVAKPNDSAGKFYLDLYMTYDNNVAGILAVDPIDSLQTLYNVWKNTVGIEEQHLSRPYVKVFYDQNMNPNFDLNGFQNTEGYELHIMDQLGRKIFSQKINSQKFVIDLSGKTKTGIYYYELVRDNETVAVGKLLLP